MRKDHHNQRKARQRSERNIFAKGFSIFAKGLKLFNVSIFAHKKILPWKNVVAYFESKFLIHN